ncbi:MAG: hypothetical protein KDJ69_16055, partial [Nitratireductor sp.]|nr:hypothetical protein [Nitratireductor sp.]
MIQVNLLSQWRREAQQRLDQQRRGTDFQTPPANRPDYPARKQKSRPTGRQQEKGKVGCGG